MPTSRISKLLAGTALAAFVGPLPAVADEQVGVVTLANPDTYSQPPGGAEAPVAMGDPIIMQQRFRTGESGQAHLLFEDKSNITIGPNSDLTIDEFVYDENAGLGSAVMSTTAGVFRFVGGQISKEQDVIVNTEEATLGIRGGMVGGGYVNGVFILFFFYGDALTVTGPNGETQLVQPGSALVLSLDGDGNLVVEPATPEQIAAFLEQLEGMGGPYDPNAAGLKGGFGGGAGGFARGIDLEELYELILELGLLDDGILTLDEIDDLVGFPDADLEDLRETLEELYSTGSYGF